MNDSVEDDRKLLSKCIGGDREAAEALVKRFSNLVYKTVQHTFRLRNAPYREQDLEDLHNTVFLGLLENSCKKLRQYRGENGCSLASWIRVVAVRIVLNHLRKKGPDAALWQKKKISIEELAQLPSEGLDPGDLMEKVEQEGLVQEGLQTLGPRDRLLIKLHFDQGLSLEEAARTLGISIENAYTVKHRAVQRLRASLRAKSM